MGYHAENRSIEMSRAKTWLGVAAALLVGVAVGRSQPPGESEDGFYRASEVIGTVVRAEDGQELGKIQDLLIEEQTQTVRFFILGEGESNLRAIPWGIVIDPQLGPDVQERFVTVRIDRQRWEQAPTFTWQEIRTGGQAAWVNQVNQFYNVEAGGQAGQRGQDAQSRDRQRQNRQQQDRQRQDQQRRNRQDQQGQQGKDAAPQDAAQNEEGQNAQQQGQAGQRQGRGEGRQNSDQQGQDQQDPAQPEESAEQPPAGGEQPQGGKPQGGT